MPGQLSAPRKFPIRPLRRLAARAVLALVLTVGTLGTALAALNVSMSVPAPFANPINPGDITALRISLANSNSASTVTGVAFTDTLPPQLVIAGAGLINYACVDGFGAAFTPTGTVTATVGTGVISLAGGTIPLAQPSGASGTCNIDVEVTSTVQGGVWTDTIPIGAVTGTDTGAVSNGSQAQQSITVNTLNPPTIAKSFASPNVIKSDQTDRLTITIGNAANPAVNLPLDTGTDAPPYAIRDALPAGLQVAATPNATSTCSGAGTAPLFTPAAGDTTLFGIGGTVAAGGTCTLMVDLVGTTTGGNHSQAVTNTISRTTDFGNERGLAAAANATASLTIVSAISVSKAFNPSTVSAGQNASLVVTITNASPVSTVTLTSFTDSPIDGVGNAAYGLKVGVPTTTCAGGAVAATAGNFGFTLTGGSLAPNTSCTVTVPYVATLQTPGTPQAFTNTIAAGAVGATDPSLVSNLSAASVTVVDQLTVSKSSIPATVAPGNPVQYTITVNNYTATALSNVKITDALPAGTIALPALPAPPVLSGAGCSTLTDDIPALPATNSTPHFTIGTFPAGVGASPGVCTVTFWAMPPAGVAVGTVLTNSIPAGGVVNNGGVGVTATNAGGSGNANATVAADITVAKAFNPANASEGTVSQLTVTFTNISAQTLTLASFTDNLPLGAPNNLQLTVANPAVASSTCVGASITATPGAATVSMSGATVPARAANGTGANGTCTLKVNVIGAAGTYVNTLPASALTGTQTFADGTTGAAASPGPITATITYSSALTAVKSFSPATIGSGGRSTVTVRLGNVGTGTLNNVSVIDPLPANLTVANPPNASITCGGSPVITAVAGASSVSMTGAVIPANIQCNLLFDVTGTGGANWTNTIPIGNVTATGGVQNVAPVTATLNNNTTGAVSVTNNTAPNSLTAPGQVSVLTVTLTNGGTVALSSLSLSNYFTVDGTSGGAPTAMVVSSSPGGATTCPGGVVSAVAGGAVVTLSGASLAVAASCTISVNVTLTAAGTVQDTIPVGAISTSQGISNTLLTVTSLSAGANVGVTKRFVPPVVQPGVRSQLQITVINAINLPVTALSVTDNLPAGVTVPASPNASTTCAGATVTAPTANQVLLTGASMAAATAGTSTTCTIFIDVVAAAAGNYTNTIAAGDVTGTAGGSATSNPIAASATLGVLNPVSIAKGFSVGTVAPGTPDTVTLTLTNPNIIALTGAVLMDSLPANLTVALVPNASTTCGGIVTATASASSVTLTGGTITAGGSCNVKFDTVSNVAGTYVNTVPGGNLATTQGVTNSNPASATVNVLNPPTVSKQFSPASIPASGVSQLSIVLGNTNASAATLTSALIDTLPTSPANIVVATPNGLTTTCPGAVTAVAGSGSVTYANGASIPANVGCTISVNVTGATTGTYTNSFATGALQTTLGSNVQPTNANLVISPLGFITGKVWKDNNVVPNGVFDAGTDTPIAGVTINLTGTDYGPNGVLGGGDDFPVSLTTITDALGNYAFTGLDAGDYTVTEPTQPAGTNNGITTAGPVAGGGGGTAGTATPIAVTPSAVSGIILLRLAGAVANSTGNNFAEVVPSTISGTAFLDQNNDGIQEAGDTPLVGVTLNLLNGANAVIATTVTDAFGNYSFSGLAPGTYSVQEPTQPTNTANGKTIAGAVANGGSAGTPTAQTVVPSVIAGIVLPPNTTTTGNNFAEVPAGRQILGRVFIDNNNDGIFNGTDTGIAGYTLTLTGTDFNGIAVNQTATTAGDGSYVFGGLAAGTYNVTEPTQPGGTSNGITTAGSTGGVATTVAVLPSSITGINLNGTNTISTGNNFAEIPAPAPLGSIGGYVYVDANNNGVIDPGETGIAGVVIKLTGTDINGVAVNLSTTSHANNGAWFFQNLTASNSAGYTITEIQPAGYADGKTTITAGAPGIATSVKPVAPGGNDVITGVVVTNTVVENYNFGELPSGGSIAGNVYVDLNNNGVLDAGEPGIPGVTVTLTGTDNTGKAVNISVQTGPDGSYSFAGLVPSGPNGYTLTETQPAAYANGRNSLGTLGGVLGSNDLITGIVLAAGGNGTGYNFGELPSASLTQTKTATDINGGDLVPGDIVEYTITTTNTGQSVAANVTVADGDVTAPFPPRVQGTAATTYVPNSTSSNGVPVADVGGNSAVAVGSGLNIGSLAPGASSIVKLRVQIPTNAPGGNLVNDASFTVPATGGTPVVTGTSTVTVKVVVTTASISGHVWLDANHNRILDPGETLEPGWTVELLQNGTVIRSTTTDQNGFYQFTGLAPGSGYQIRFRDPDSGVIFGRPVTNEQNNGANPTGASTADGTLNGMTLTAGENVVQQSLPLDPSGVVYNAVTRVPVKGATVQLTGPAGFNPATQLVGGALMNVSGASASQVTGTDGYYEFVFINLGLPGGPPAGTYTISVTPPAGQGYVTTQPSTLIPPSGTVVVPGPSGGVDAIQGQSNAPPVGAVTTYYLNLAISGTSAGVVNNHIPLDPVQNGTIFVSKTTSSVNVSRGDLVPYTITATNMTTSALTNVRVSDVIPPGFRFRLGSATLNGVPTPPTVNVRELDWSGLSFAPSEKKIFKLMLVVGSGVSDGDFTNTSFASNVSVVGTPGTVISNVSTATVRVAPDPLFDCPDLIGKVFDDRNFNGYQDEGEPGIPNVRLVTAEGLVVTTDAQGRYHITCPMIPNEFRGSNFVVKLDVRTLPAGYRVTTENPNTVRLTAGKMSKLNFGAALLRVFRVEVNGDAFVDGGHDLKPEWMAKLDGLMLMLRERPAVVRVAYSARTAGEPAQKRLDAVAAEIRRRWQNTQCCYTLAVETELIDGKRTEAAP
jgi:uncharacterized repeat protein (TIGR01451 family)